MKRIITSLSVLLLAAFAAGAQTASSLFWRADSLQVTEIRASDNKQYTKVGHHGPAVENSHMALRLYFNDSGAIDVYSKSGNQMELLKYLWYPTEEQQKKEDAGCDEYFVGKTVGLGGISLWDDGKIVKLSMTEGRVARVGKTAAGSYAEIISYGIPYGGDKVDISVRVDVYDGSRDAIVTARSLTGKEVEFVTGVNFNSGSKIKVADGHISIWGKHPVNVSKHPVPIGGGMCYDPSLFGAPEETGGMVRIISKPCKAVSTKIVSASVKERQLGKARRFHKYVMNMTAPIKTPVRLHLTGDSTCTNAKPKRGAHRGWGQMLHFFFDKQNVEVRNWAISGTSSRSFKDKGWWAKAVAEFRPGDIVTVQFGINDSSNSKANPDRATTLEAFADTLRSYVREIRAHECRPVLMTVLASRTFKNGEYEPAAKRLERNEVIIKIAQEMNVPLIDCHSISVDWIKGMGDLKSRNRFCWFGPGFYPDNEKAKDGKKDNTHMNQVGAFEFAPMMADELIRIFPELAAFRKGAEYSEAEAEFGPIPIDNPENL